MKRKIIAIIIVTVVAAGATWLFSTMGSSIGDAPVGNGGQHQQENTAEYYTCPMHPSVRSDRPGACPVCGMALVKKSASQTSEVEPDRIGAVTLSPTQRVMANISTVPAQRKTLRREITAVGVVDFAEPLRATVAARFRGRIEKLHARFTGEVVRKGAPLFELYSPDLVSASQEYLLALEGMKTATGSLQGTLDMQRELLHATRDRLRVHFGLTEQQIVGLEQSHDSRTTIMFHSPISGTVIRKQVTEGDYVDEGMVLYELADLSTVWVYLDLYEKDIRYVIRGQEIHLRSEAYPGEVFAGMVTFIDPVVNAETRTVRVRTQFANPKGRLKPNMYVQATVTVPIRNVLTVPAAAVLSTGRRSVVWVEVEENVFEPRDVLIGTVTDAFTEILRGLVEGEKVAETGGFLIDSESALQQPTSVDPHAGHAAEKTRSSDPVARPSERKRTASNGEAVGNEVKILVKGRYTPDVIRVKLGKPVKLHFYRDEDADCTNEVVFEGLHIRRRLPARETTTIELTPGDSGEIAFSCGMGMVRGKLIVED